VALERARREPQGRERDLREGRLQAGDGSGLQEARAVGHRASEEPAALSHRSRPIARAPRSDAAEAAGPILETGDWRAGESRVLK